MIAALLLLAAAADCDGDQPQQMLNICAAQAAEAADAEMNAQWKLTIAKMRHQDREIDRTYDKQPGYFDTLLAGQRAWLTYRDRQCLLESFEMRGGSAAAGIHSGCLERVTRERLGQLKSLIETGN